MSFSVVLLDGNS